MNVYLKTELAAFVVAKRGNRLAITRASRLEVDYFIHPAKPSLIHSETSGGNIK